MKSSLITVLMIIASLFISSCEGGDIFPNPKNEFEEYVNKYAVNGIPNIEILENDLQSGIFKVVNVSDNVFSDASYSFLFCDADKIYTYGTFDDGDGYGQPFEEIHTWKIENNELRVYSKLGLEGFAKILHYDGQYLLMQADEDEPWLVYRSYYVRLKFIAGEEGRKMREYYRNDFMQK